MPLGELLRKLNTDSKRIGESELLPNDAAVCTYLRHKTPLLHPS
jgi:hypothetical protein